MDEAQTLSRAPKFGVDLSVVLVGRCQENRRQSGFLIGSCLAINRLLPGQRRSKQMADAFRSLLFLLLVVGLSACGWFSGDDRISHDGASERSLADVSAATIAGPRLALIIAQTNYSNSAEFSRVNAAESEADHLFQALTATGFSVRRERNLSRDDLERVLGEFRVELDGAGPDAVGFVYYTGHGAQHPDGDSYLLGVDARLRVKSDYAAYGVSMVNLRNAFGATGSRAVFLVFDACRNVPQLAQEKSGSKGIGRLDASANMLIAYSTDADDTAKEGIYAPVLAEEIRREGQIAVAAFSEAQRRVAELTGGDQRPWFDPRIYNKICFASCEPSKIVETSSSRFDILLSNSETHEIRTTARELARRAIVDEYGDGLCFEEACRDSDAITGFVDIRTEFVVRFDSGRSAVVLSTDFTQSGANNCHACSGTSSVVYFDSLQEGKPVSTFIDFTYGTSWGGAPEFELRSGLTPYPAMILRGGGMWQGCGVTTSDIFEITPSGPKARGTFVTAYHAGHLGNFRPGEDEAVIQREIDAESFTSEIKSTDDPSRLRVFYEFGDRKTAIRDLVFKGEVFEPVDGKDLPGGC